MTETRIIYGPAETAGCPSTTEIINRALAAGSCYGITTAPDAIRSQARVAELEEALSEIEALTATESPMTYQWVRCEMADHVVPENQTVIYSNPPFIPKDIRICYDCLYEYAQAMYPDGAVVRHIQNLRRAGGVK